MSTTGIVLTSVLGSLGYLLVGWVTCVVGAAITADHDGDLIDVWWGALLLWPVAVVVVVILLPGSRYLTRRLDRVTRRAIKFLNPKATGRWGPG